MRRYLFLAESNDVAWIKVAFAALGLCSLMSPPGYAQGIPQAYLCGGLIGTYVGAPTWKAEADGASGQQVLLDFKGANNPGSNVKWYRDGKVYYESPGGGIAMKNGFAIITLADDRDYIETYVFNAGTSELLFSMTRSGSSVLPNSLKFLRGTCQPAGAMVR